MEKECGGQTSFQRGNQNQQERERDVGGEDFREQESILYERTKKGRDTGEVVNRQWG